MQVIAEDILSLSNQGWEDIIARTPAGASDGDNVGGSSMLDDGYGGDGDGDDAGCDSDGDDAGGDDENDGDSGPGGPGFLVSQS